jgi:hypothetical protein
MNLADDLNETRRGVFLESLQYINIDQAVNQSITNGINNANDMLLANIQAGINLNNIELNQLELGLLDGGLTQVQINKLIQLAQTLFNVFNELGMLNQGQVGNVQGGAVAPKKKTRFLKGSQEAKDFMASIRAKKGKLSK